VSDALASAGVIVAGVLILRYELYIADLTITVVIGDFVIWQGVTLLPRTVRLLMGAVPDESEFDRIVSDLRDAEGVADVHHVSIVKRHASCTARPEKDTLNFSLIAPVRSRSAEQITPCLGFGRYGNKVKGG